MLVLEARHFSQFNLVLSLSLRMASHVSSKGFYFVPRFHLTIRETRHCICSFVDILIPAALCETRIVTYIREYNKRLMRIRER